MYISTIDQRAPLPFVLQKVKTQIVAFVLWEMVVQQLLASLKFSLRHMDSNLYFVSCSVYSSKAFGCETEPGLLLLVTAKRCTYSSVLHNNSHMDSCIKSAKYTHTYTQLASVIGCELTSTKTPLFQTSLCLKQL